jgi:hypothetical protein
MAKKETYASDTVVPDVFRKTLKEFEADLVMALVQLNGDTECTLVEGVEDIAKNGGEPKTFQGRLCSLIIDIRNDLADPENKVRSLVKSMYQRRLWLNKVLMFLVEEPLIGEAGGYRCKEALEEACQRLVEKDLRELSRRLFHADGGIRRVYTDDDGAWVDYVDERVALSVAQGPGKDVMEAIHGLLVPKSLGFLKYAVDEWAPLRHIAKEAPPTCSCQREKRNGS